MIELAKTFWRLVVGIVTTLFRPGWLIGASDADTEYDDLQDRRKLDNTRSRRKSRLGWGGK